MRIRYLPLSAVVVLSVPANAVAVDERPPALDGVAQCRGIKDTAARTACYDRTVPILIDAVDKKTIVVLDKTEVQRTRKSLFGFALPKLPFFGTDREEKDDKTVVRELSTKILKVNATGYGLWSITLAEGGVWRTTEPSRTLTPHAGDTITIKRGMVGGYMATIGGERQIRLQRIG